MNPVKRRNRLFPYCWAKGVSASLAALFILSFTACGKKEPEVAKEVIRPVKTLTVKSGAGVEGLTLPGKVRASKRVNLAFKEVGGRLSHLPIAGKEGQDVKKGALLARIDPKDFQTNLANAQGRLKTAKAGQELAKKEYARVKRIRDKDPGAVSGADIDRKMEAVNQSEGRIKSLKATVDDARNQLSYTYLRAPFSGVIARRFVDNFQEVKPKQPIVSLQDITNVEILVDVPENVIAISPGDSKYKIVVEFPTLPGKQYPVNVKEKATDADPSTQTYQVVLQMPQPKEIRVLPGMTATVKASISGRRTTEGDITIPAIAVLADPKGQDYVWVVDTKEMTVKKRDVSIGRVTGSEDIRILKGLKGGENIVVAGVLKLQDGMKVRFWDKQ
ncbi:MAG: efflux RND transporter periplasmic adaptor subunit [Deltaproteobacteria bacterium]|nr:efflux RND transporter periplasmic adaptor subunit [Deltaproteobacteria bacterium]